MRTLLFLSALVLFTASCAPTYTTARAQETNKIVTTVQTTTTCVPGISFSLVVEGGVLTVAQATVTLNDGACITAIGYYGAPETLLTAMQTGIWELQWKGQKANGFNSVEATTTGFVATYKLSGSSETTMTCDWVNGSTLTAVCNYSTAAGTKGGPNTQTGSGLHSPQM
jgi:hypothetical protein